MLELDGSFGEGGGQILRTSLALSLLTGRAFHLCNVRAGRPKPGLQPQHLMSVRAASAIGQARTRGASLGSSDLVFEPGEVRAGAYRFDVGTAGATGLVLHTLYLPLALRGATPSELTLLGGTHVSTSPCFHFLDTTWRRYLELCGLRVSLRLNRPGFYPRGGGAIEAFIQPCDKLHGIRLEARGSVKASGFSAVAGLDASIARRQARRATFRLRQHGLKAQLREETWPGGPGTVLAVELDTTPVPTLFFALGARGKPAERVADEAVDQAIAYLDAGDALVDAHSADQMVLPLALAEGASQYRIAEVTRHLTTNIAVIRRFLERDIVCEGEEGEAGVVRIAAKRGRAIVDISLQIAQIVPCTEAEGPGRRFAVWLQGCPLRCPGCCNPEMLSFEGGTAISLGDLVAQIEAAADTHGVEGVTLLGGEPLAHAAGAAALARAVRRRGLTVMVFSGYTLEEARQMSDPAVAELLALTDILVDGPYLRDRPETRRRWIGSANQRIHFLSDRYRGDDPRWLLPNTLEIRLRGAELTVNGFPARSAVGLWKRPPWRTPRHP